MPCEMVRTKGGGVKLRWSRAGAPLHGAPRQLANNADIAAQKGNMRCLSATTLSTPRTLK